MEQLAVLHCLAIKAERHVAGHAEQTPEGLHRILLCAAPVALEARGRIHAAALLE
jgi:hypothetical protein